MRWILCACALAPLFFVAACEISTPTEVGSPQFSMALEDLHVVTGGGTVTTPFGQSVYAFAARQSPTGVISGQVELHFTSADIRIHAEVTCLAVSGPDAWLGAVVTQSPLEDHDFAPGGDFVWRVADNGEGTDVNPDRVSGFWGGPPASACNDRVDYGQREWGNGNVQIRTNGKAPSGSLRLCGSVSSDGIARFEDANLEAAVRSALGLDAGDLLTCEDAATLAHLDAGDSGIGSLEGAQNLTGLLLAELGNNGITDVSPMAGLSSLWGLGLFRNAVEDLTPIAGLTGLTFLELSGNRITDVSPLAGLASLDHLGVAANGLTDIRPLASLSALRVLGAGNNELIDVSAVAHMVGVEELYLTNNESLTDVSPLFDNPGLDAGDRVGLLGTAVSCEDVNLLRARGIEVFSDCGPSGPIVLGPTEYCSENPADAIATFADANLEGAVREALGLGPSDDLTCGLAASLGDFWAEVRAIESLAGAQNLTGLYRLELGGNQISDIGPLGTLVNLEALGVGANPLADLGPIAGLTSLRVLGVQNSQVSQLDPLAALTNLEWLFLDGNAISDISPLSGLTGLTILGLAGNSVSDISGLAGLTTLQSLALQNNAVADVTPLGGLVSLTELWLTDNPTGDIAALSGLLNLTVLGLAGNGLSDITPLRNMTSLSYVGLEGNPFSNLGPLLDNEGIGEGDVVDLWSAGVSCEDVNRLRDKGVQVGSECTP